MFKKKKHVKSDWLRGLHEAEEYILEGWYYDDVQSSGNHVYFKHPDGGSLGWLALNWSFTRGLLDYVEHHKLNGEIMQVGDKVKLLENDYSELDDGDDKRELFEPGNTGVVHELVSYNKNSVYVVLDNDPDKYPYYMYLYEVEFI